jgi:EH domain-containing protein 3
MDSNAFPILEDSKRFKPFLDGLKEIYHHRIRPVEELYNFDGFYSKPITNSELEAKPIVLLLGQYSTGKTSFIEYLLGSPYPGAHIGPEPTTDRFVAVMHGLEDNVIPGNAAAIQVDKPFRTLTQFGSSFLSKFQLSLTPNPLVDSISLIDTPGILSGEKQRLGRAYDFVKVCQWFAEKSDIILLFFDAHKLDISDEFKAVISSLKTHDNKIRVILNKADSVTHQQLMRM